MFGGERWGWRVELEQVGGKKLNQYGLYKDCSMYSR